MSVGGIGNTKFKKNDSISLLPPSMCDSKAYLYTYLLPNIKNKLCSSELTTTNATW